MLRRLIGWLRRSRGPRVLAAAGILGLSLSVMAAQPASAFVDPSKLLKYGETLAAPVVETVGTEEAVGAGASLCSTGVGCIAAVGVVAYATKDLWWPVVKGLFGGEHSEPAKGGTSCQINVSPKGLNAAGTGLTLTWSWTGCTGSKDLYFTGARTIACRAASGVVTTSTGTSSTPSNVTYGQPSSLYYTTSGTLTADATGAGLTCGSGQTLVSFSLASVAMNSGGQVAGGISWGSKVPDDQLSTTATMGCTLPDGTKQTIKLTTKGDPDGFQVPSCRNAFPGSIPNQLDVTSGYAGAEQPVDHVVFNDPHNDYADCFDAAGAYTGACVVRVWVNGQPCHVGVSICASWQTADTDLDATVECRWGSYKVAIKNCDALADQYRADAGTKTVTSTSTLPGGSTGTGTGTGTDPESGTGGESLPASGTNPSTDPSPDGKSCLGSGWSWNPLHWVYVPVKCALVWAFEPDPEAVAGSVSGVADSWNDTAPAKWMGALGGLVLPQGSDLGCEGPNVHVPLLEGKSVDFHPLDACEDPVKTAAAVCKGILTAVVVVGGIFGCVRALGSGLGWSMGAKAGEDL